MKFQEVFRRLNGRDATPDDMLKFERLTTTLETTPGDAFLSVLVALDHYERLYASIPAKIEEATTAAAKNAAIQAESEVNKAVAKLIPTVEEGVRQAAAQAISRMAYGKWLFHLWTGMLAASAFFATGWLFGWIINLRVAANIAFFWQFKWAFALGAAAPSLLVLALALDYKGKGKWWGIGTGALAAICVIAIVLLSAGVF